MNKKRSFIRNPNTLSTKEKLFVQNDHHAENDKYKGRMISMSDSFYLKLNNYLKQNPTEGNRSSFIVRIVAEYINKSSSKEI